jgi:hypothetical protein
MCHLFTCLNSRHEKNGVPFPFANTVEQVVYPLRKYTEVHTVYIGAVMDTHHLKLQMTVSYHNVSDAKVRNYFDIDWQSVLLIYITFAVNMIKK